MSEDAVNGRSGVEPPRDPDGAQTVGHDSDVGADAASSLWGADIDVFSDPAETGMFSDEIENIDASDWDADASGIWGDDGDGAGLDDGGAIGLDFPL
ncbi:hypothetical protein ASD65_15840 [Microbacterium sp. Root61]|uniref:hypothetical protein n=1 Tax=Microbacterium sp. Root61 TaxID=1736570 RepID=UPI0006FDBCB1|nr:hypothetical protein [Microbacterium sp. Root61]KRA25730.1 hypothetical protein ASD65_15840 [Microbacterium sp. Root61]